MAETINRLKVNQRLTRNQKEANNFKWYREQADMLDTISFNNSTYFGYDGISEYRRMKVNYDLFNNIVNKNDFDYVCKPFGDNIGDLPADFTNKDIVSGKIKALLGMEMKRPFSWKVIAVNDEAHTRREEIEFNKIRDFVIGQIMMPIRLDIEKRYQESIGTGSLTDDQIAEIQKNIAAELEAATPDDVRKYMEREHQDPAEALSSQILEYLVQKEDMRMKFNKGWKHGLISGREIFWVGIENGEPKVRVVNPLRFDYDKSPDDEFIEDAEWQVAEFRMTPSQIVSIFGDELSPSDIDDIYNNYSYYGEEIADDLFSFRVDSPDDGYNIRVLHATWTSLRRLGFLTYGDNGTIQEDIVDETYELNPDQGDIDIEWKWIPEKYEVYKIGTDKYVFPRAIPGQFRDLDNLYNCKGPYYGVSFDNLNSEVTSVMDRLKVWQYYYNIIMYRLELLMASDEGKMLLMNMNLVPRKSKIDSKKWLYYLKSSKIGWLDPSQEGSKFADITNAAKEIDMSLASDIAKYVELAEYIERRAGESIGLPKEVEAQIEAEQAVSNVRQTIVQSSNILEPYFELHNYAKRNVLQALIENAKVAYSEFKPRKLSYVLDDMSTQMLDIDFELLDDSTYGIFVSNSIKAHEAIEITKQLSHAALQNQKIELSDVVKIMRAESLQEAEELLLSSEKARLAREERQMMAVEELKAKESEKERNWEREKMQTEHQHNMEEIQLEGEIDLRKQVMLSVGFNEDKDMDDDGQLDVVELYKAGQDAQIKARKQKLDEKKFKSEEEQRQIDNKNKEKELEIKEKQANKSQKTQ